MRFSHQRITLIGAAIVAALLSLSAVAAHAVDATWNLNGTGEFNNNLNWTPTQVPTGFATFGQSNQTSVTISNSSNTLDTIQINAGAPAYTFTITNDNVTLTSGVVNNSSIFPTFNISAGSV